MLVTPGVARGAPPRPEPDPRGSPMARGRLGPVTLREPATSPVPSSAIGRATSSTRTIGSRSCWRHRRASPRPCGCWASASEHRRRVRGRPGLRPVPALVGSRVYGHDQVRILDGGLERWAAERHPVERGDATRAAPVALRTWNPRAGIARSPRRRTWPRPSTTRRSSSSIRVRPSSSAARPSGSRPDPSPQTLTASPNARGDLRAGHVPWARNVPAGTALSADGTLRPPAELRELFAEAGYPPGHAGDHVLRGRHLRPRRSCTP